MSDCEVSAMDEYMSQPEHPTTDELNAVLEELNNDRSMPPVEKMIKLYECAFALQSKVAELEEKAEARSKLATPSDNIRWLWKNAEREVNSLQSQLNASQSVLKTIYEASIIVEGDEELKDHVIVREFIERKAKDALTPKDEK